MTPCVQCLPPFFCSIVDSLLFFLCLVSCHTTGMFAGRQTGRAIRENWFLSDPILVAFCSLPTLLSCSRAPFRPPFRAPLRPCSHASLRNMLTMQLSVMPASFLREENSKSQPMHLRLDTYMSFSVAARLRDAVHRTGRTEGMPSFHHHQHHHDHHHHHHHHHHRSPFTVAPFTVASAGN